jgi:hypothetical protein
VLVVVVLAVQFLQGRLVALVHQEELALSRHLIQQFVERAVPDLERDGLARQMCERPLAELMHAHVQRQQDFFLGSEVVVDRRLGDAEPFRDLAHGGAVETLVGEQV